MIDPEPEADDAGAVVIRNRRCGRWSTPLWRWVGYVCAVTALIAATGWLPREWRGQAFTVVALVSGGSFVWLMHSLYHGPVASLHLGPCLTALPLRTYATEDIDAVRFAADPAEDYADDESEQAGPVRLTEATIEVAHGPALRLVVAVEDAVRIRSWAARRAIRVIDPEGYPAAGRGKVGD